MSKTVLIAEDDPSIRSALQAYLQAKGMDVITARDGAEAIALLDQALPAVVVLDLLMPKIDGLEVLRHLRERDARIPVIISTNLSKGYDPQKWEELGASEVVIKSQISLKQLADKIRGYMAP